MTDVADLVGGARRRLLAYDEKAAQRYGIIRAACDAAGEPRGVEDLMIAAICLTGSHAIATRNVRHFEGLGLDVINPWEPAGDA